MTFSFIFLTISIKKRTYTERELKRFRNDQKILDHQEELKNRYYNYFR
ncbi:YrzI family small protein [Bacillus sp. JCM 19041]